MKEKRGKQFPELTAAKSPSRFSFAWLGWFVVIAYIVLNFTHLFERRTVVLPHEPAAARLPESNGGKRNVIFMVSDGMGPASVALARNFFQHTNDKGLSPITLDRYFVGNSRTQSSDSYVTDSAAGATAFSCCLKTYNGAIGVDPEGLPCATIMEAAKLEGYRTGLVVTTRITDATPASFASHAHYRFEEDFIAEQLVNWKNSHPFGNMVDLMFGGGRCHFLPSSVPGSCRHDERDLVSGAKKDGWAYLDSIDEFHELGLGKNVSLPVLGLFADGDLPFTIDYHDDSLPRLNETAITAVRALAEATKDSDQGFFLLVEGSRIDHAGHSNDPGAQVREVLGYNDAFEAMVHYAEHEADVPTIVVSTSDHETGGLSVSRQVTKEYPEYLWYPEVLARAKHSSEFLSRKLRDLDHSVKGEKLRDFIRHEILGKNGLGFTDVSDKEVRHLAHHRSNSHDYLTRLQSIRAQVGWSTHGHSAVDVNVYAAASDNHYLDTLRGANENTEVGQFMRDFLHISGSKLESLTTQLRERFGDRFLVAETQQEIEDEIEDETEHDDYGAYHLEYIAEQAHEPNGHGPVQAEQDCDESISQNGSAETQNNHGQDEDIRTQADNSYVTADPHSYDTKANEASNKITENAESDDTEAEDNKTEDKTEQPGAGDVNKDSNRIKPAEPAHNSAVTSPESESRIE